GENLRFDNAESWSAVSIQKFHKILEDCIPHMRFFRINRKDYYLKVYPFRRILPSQLKKDLNSYYFVPKFHFKEKLEGYAPQRSKKTEDTLVKKIARKRS
ncbi:3173_t:CDS:1, partial [Ambispora gerdemannii]